jgi:putative flippase GtrA
VTTHAHYQPTVPSVGETVRPPTYPVAGVPAQREPDAHEWDVGVAQASIAPSTERSRMGSAAARLARPLRFLSVGAICFALQLGILFALTEAAVLPAVVANAIAFLVSAQINFLLSSVLTWRDRLPGTTQAVCARRWAKFNVVALVAVAVNSVGFAAGQFASLSPTACAVCGAFLGLLFSYTTHSLLTFRVASEAECNLVEQRPSIEQVRRNIGQRSVAFFMPAYNEEENIERTSDRVLEYLSVLGCEHRLYVVNDGSRDCTASVLARLEVACGGRFRVLHHDVNRGYGAALITGIEACVTDGRDLIAFCDSDGQFEIESFGTLLAAMDAAKADLAAGYRLKRADSWCRLALGKAWHWLSRLVLGHSSVRDVDYGFKLFSAEGLRVIAPKLVGQYASVSPEIVARLAWTGRTITEAGINHRPRARGEQTGANAAVVVRSLSALVRLRLARTDNKEIEAAA